MRLIHCLKRKAAKARRKARPGWQIYSLAIPHPTKLREELYIPDVAPMELVIFAGGFSITMPRRCR